MVEPPPLSPPLKRSRLHTLSWWSLGLTVASALLFTAGFVIAANSSKQSTNGWVGDLCVALTFITAPICVLAACVTGAMGVSKRGNCLSGVIMAVPVVVIALMVLFTWIALVAASRFR